DDVVELLVVGERPGVPDRGLHAGGPRGRHQLRARVDGRHVAAGVHEPARQRAVAAAEVKYALARPRVEQVEHRGGQVADVRGVGAVPLGVPDLTAHVTTLTPRAV